MVSLAITRYLALAQPVLHTFDSRDALTIESKISIPGMPFVHPIKITHVKRRCCRLHADVAGKASERKLVGAMALKAFDATRARVAR